MRSIVGDLRHLRASPVSQAAARAGFEGGRVLQWIDDHKARLPTPMYLYDERALRDSATEYRSLFPGNSRLFYSLKANPQPGLVRRLSSMGIGAEIAGGGELYACRTADVPPAQILAGGVSKSDGYTSEILNMDPAAIVIDSESEWYRLKRVLAGSQHPAILLRVNPGDSFGGLNMAGGTQFGLSVEQAIAVARECAGRRDCRFMGLHFYFGSQRLSVPPILEALSAVEDTIHSFSAAGVRPGVVDVGLGCGVPYLAKDPVLDVAALGSALASTWENDAWVGIEVWAEAGRALVARSGYFVARVIERKSLHGKTFIFLDGGLNVHNPGNGLGRFFRDRPNLHFVAGDAAGATEQIDLVGNLCTSADSFGQDITAPKLREGDLVVIPNSGAYCSTTALWGFNTQPPFSEGMLENGALSLLESQHQLIRSQAVDAAAAARRR